IMADQNAKLELGGKTHEFQTRKGTVGPDVIDISSLYKETGAFTYDPGFTSTASCESKITYIDGDEGVLLYRGTLSSSWLSKATSSKPATCCFTASCRRRHRKRISIIA